MSICFDCQQGRNSLVNKDFKLWPDELTTLLQEQNRRNTQDLANGYEITTLRKMTRGMKAEHKEKVMNTLTLGDYMWREKWVAERSTRQGTHQKVAAMKPFLVYNESGCVH